MSKCRQNCTLKTELAISGSLCSQNQKGMLRPFTSYQVEVLINIRETNCINSEFTFSISCSGFGQW